MAEGTPRPRGILDKIQMWVASVALTAMMLVVSADVILRQVFNVPVRGAYDLVSIGLLTMVFFGIGPVIARQSEILIDLVDGFLPASVLRALKALASIGTLVVFLFLGWAMIGPALDARRYGDRLLELGIPVWWLWAVAFAGLATIIAVTVMRLVRGEGGDTPSAEREEGAL